MSVYVIVDDSDSGLHYTPDAECGQYPNASLRANGWCVGAKANTYEFNEKTSSPGLKSSTMSYTFNGSSIWVFGSKAAPYVHTNVSYSIDGQVAETGSYPPPSTSRYHFPYFSYISLSFGTHTLGIEVTGTEASTTDISDFFIDYLIYEASVNSTIPTADDRSSWVFIDDTSPYLTVSSDWSKTLPNFTPPEGGNEDITDAVLNWTILAPTASGATISLNFTGASRIEAYAMALQSTSSGQLGTFSIDGQGSSPLQVPTTYPAYLWQILTNTILDPDNSHVLTITASQENAFFLDYILLETDSAFVTSRTLSSDPSIGSVSAIATIPSSQTPTAPAAQSKHENVGGTVGGVVGGAVVVALVGFVIVFILRRRRLASNTEHGGRPLDFTFEATDSARMQEQGWHPGLSADLYQRSEYTTNPTPFLPESLVNDSGRVNSQSRKIRTDTRTATPTSNRIATGLGLSTISERGNILERPSTELIIESDSGLRGSEIVRRLPPQYTLE